MDIFKEKIKFEKLLAGEKIYPLTIAYHGSIFNRSRAAGDLDVILIIESITPQLFKRLNHIMKMCKIHLGITLVSVREAGTIFGGLKYQDALYRRLGQEEKHPYAYYKIATLNEQFRKCALEMNIKKCNNIAKVITKTINNFLGSNLFLNIGNFDQLVRSVERNLNIFYNREKIKTGRYKESVRVK